MIEGTFPMPPIHDNKEDEHTSYAFPEYRMPLIDDEKPIVILQLADIRYGWKGPHNLYEDAHNKAWQALINTFKDKKVEGIGDPDIVAICGDIAYSGKQEEYENCKSNFINTLLETLGIPSDHLLTCPGNHDRDINKDSVRLYIPEKNVRITESRKRSITKATFESMSEDFHNYSNAFFNKEGLDTLVYSRCVQDICFLSLNSAWFSSYYVQGDGNLLIGKESCKDQIEILHEYHHKEGKKTIVLIHHPLHSDKRGFSWYHIEERESDIDNGKESFLQYVENSAFIVLTGSPVFKQNIIPEPKGKCTVSCGIIRDEKQSKGNYSYSAALIEIFNNNVSVHILSYDLMEGGDYWKLNAGNFKFSSDSPMQQKDQAQTLENLLEYVLNDPEVTLDKLRSLWRQVRGNRAVRESTKNKLIERILTESKQTSPDEELGSENLSERDLRAKR